MSRAVSWSPGQYLKFEEERTRPARDLLAQVSASRVERVVDVGCGPGNSTEILLSRWPDADVLGIDTSEAMLAEAQRRLPAARFALADAADWLPEQGTDLVFANAVYQWVPDHRAVFPRVLERLPPGGVFAVQMPDNLAEPTHRLMSEVAARMPFADRLAGAGRAPLPAASTYYDALASLASRVDIWRTTYIHVLADAAAIVEWVKSTGLAPFLQPLDAAEREHFLGSYVEAISAAYPPTADGRVLLPFPRLFIVATR